MNLMIIFFTTTTAFLLFKCTEASSGGGGGLVAIPDYMNLRINENLLLNTEYFLSTIYYKTTNKLNYKLKYLPKSKFNMNCTSFINDYSMNELIDNVSEFDISMKNFAHNDLETIDKVYLVVKTKLDYETRVNYGLCLILNSDSLKPTLLTIKVEIMDLNDNAPVFEKMEYDASVMEGRVAPFELDDLNVQAVDKDTNSTITYSLIADDEENTSSQDIPFEINPQTGRIRCIRTLDRELKSMYKLKLVANDNNSIQPLVGYSKLRIKVQDVNDNKPMVKFLFADSIFEYDFTDLLNQRSFNQINNNTIETTKISENTLEGSFICYLVVVDLDSLDNTKLQVSINGNGKEYFALEKSTFDMALFQLPSSSDLVPVINLYTLTLAKQLDREIKDNYELVISLNDNNETFIERKLDINVQDANDNEPVFESTQYDFSIFDDDYEADYCFGKIEANDPDLGVNGTIEYLIVNYTSACNHSLPVSLNKTTGELCISDKLICLKYSFSIQAKDTGIQPLTSKIDATVSLTKRFLSDNKPIFFQQDVNKTFNFNRYSPAESIIGLVKAYTFDYGINSMIEYRVSADTNNTSLNEQLSTLFSIDTEGYLRNVLEISELEIKEIPLKIIATNLKLPKLLSEISVIIRLDNETSIENFIPTQTVLYLTSNQVDYLKLHQNLSIFKLFKEDGIQYKVDYLEENCKNLFEMDRIGDLYVRNYTDLITDDLCTLNITMMSHKITKAIDLIIVLSNNLNSSALLFKRTKTNKGFLSIDFNQLLIIFIIFVFSLLLSILTCLIILMKCRKHKNKDKKLKEGDDGLFVHTKSNDTSSNSGGSDSGNDSATNKSPTSSSTSSIENSSSTTNSKLTEIESIENLKTLTTSIWLGNPTSDDDDGQQINEANYLQFNNNNNNIGNKLLKQQQQHQKVINNNNNNKRATTIPENDLIATVHWSPSCTSSISPISTSTTTAVNTNNHNFDNNNYFKQSGHPINNLGKLDEGCYGSSDMSGDSIDVDNPNNLLKKPTTPQKKNYCGIYHLNTTQTCIIDADIQDNLSNDSAIQIINEREQHNKTVYGGGSSNSQLKSNYQLERFEKLYYQGEQQQQQKINNNNNNNNYNSNSLNLTVSKHLNRHQPIRGSFV